MFCFGLENKNIILDVITNPTRIYSIRAVSPHHSFELVSGTDPQIKKNCPAKRQFFTMKTIFFMNCKNSRKKTFYAIAASLGAALVISAVAKLS